MDKYRSNQSYFNPLPSHEGRPVFLAVFLSWALFQSAPLTRGETQRIMHSLIEGHYFNPLPSHEGRREFVNPLFSVFTFQSAPLTRGETLKFTPKFSALIISIRSPHTRGDARIGFLFPSPSNFNPLPSHEGRLACIVYNRDS